MTIIRITGKFSTILPLLADLERIGNLTLGEIMSRGTRVLHQRGNYGFDRRVG